MSPCLDDVLDLQLGPGQHLDEALAVGDEEEIILAVPGQLVHLEPELFLCLDLEGFRVDKRDQVLLVTYSDGFTVRRPADINVLPLGINRGDALVCL